ncbi:MAG: metal-dependent hydrolase [Pseudomonadales bacterium]|jgi:inner membrane protein
MDPITQGTLGATLSESFSDKHKVKVAALLGCLGGLAPDIDVLFQSPTDPLVFLEFHRQFTHSLIFIPIGALICALLAWRFTKATLTFKETWWFCFLGYATHGLLDACTTYGTQLLWPITNERFAWNNVSIIDPMFTLPLLILVIIGVRRKAPMFSRIALAWAFTYLSIGLIQRDRAEDAGLELATSRGHSPIRIEAKPGFANLLLWKIVYETEDKFYVDAVRVGINTKIFQGEHIDKLDTANHLPWLDPSSQQAADIKRFAWFSNDYLAMDRNIPNRIIDIRYSMLPNEINALWAIQLNPSAGISAHVDFTNNRDASSRNLSQLITMLLDD